MRERSMNTLADAGEEEMNDDALLSPQKQFHLHLRSGGENKYAVIEYAHTASFR